jgi:protein phosphatase 2C
MEDAHISMPSFLSSSSKLVDLASSKSAPLHFFGVLDGHGGEACAEYCGDALPKQLKKSLSSGLPISASLVTAHAAVEVDWFREADRDDSGTTAVTALIESASGRVLASNVGDSRVLVVRRSGKSGSKVVALTR